jgi:hypothetical protein
VSTFTSRLLTALSCAALFWSCAGDTSLQCKKDPITGSDRCQPVSSSGGEAAVMAGMATAGWAAAGCTVNGCLGAYRCNGKTKQCEPIECGEDAPCPAPYECNLAIHRCE